MSEEDYVLCDHLRISLVALQTQSGTGGARVVKVLQPFDMPAVQYQSLASILEKGQDNSSVDFKLR